MKTKMYHGSTEEIIKIDENLGFFGGIFATDKEGASGHGDIIHELVVPINKITTVNSLQYDVDPTDFISRETGLTDKNAINLVAEMMADSYLLNNLIREEEQYNDEDEPKLWLISEWIRCLTVDTGWELQRLSGKFVKENGFWVCELEDEHGVSYLVVSNNVKIEILK